MVINNKMEIKDDNLCPICMSIPQKDNIFITKCNHKFCSSCISEWEKIKNTCPICRTKVKEPWEYIQIVKFMILLAVKTNKE